MPGMGPATCTSWLFAAASQREDHSLVLHLHLVDGDGGQVRGVL